MARSTAVSNGKIWSRESLVVTGNEARAIEAFVASRKHWTVGGTMDAASSDRLVETFTMAGQKITIALQGKGSDRGHVRLEELTDQLENIRRALSYAEDRAAIGGRRKNVHYRVVDLHHSVATLVIEPIAEDPENDRTNAIVYEFRTRLRQIQQSRVPDDVSIEELEAYRALVPKPDQHITQLTITFDAPTILRNVEEYTVTPDYDARLAAIIGPEEVAWGTLTGHLEAINLHERNVFYLWPRVGPRRVYCTFERAIREDVRAALGHFVEAAGRVHYRRRSNLATSMSSVHSIEILDNNAAAGTLLSELRGIAPNATGGMDTRDFVDSYDEDW